MSRAYQNRWGRRPGRGVRPWLLLPKLLAVTVYLGSLAATLFIWLTSGFASLDAADPRRLWIINQIGHLARFLVVPSLLVALAFGAALLLQHPRPFIRMRWLQVKLLSLALLVPAGHFFLSSRLGLLRAAFARQAADPAAHAQFTWGLILVLAGSIWVMILGRLKPRLGQRIGRTFAAAHDRLPGTEGTLDATDSADR